MVEITKAFSTYVSQKKQDSEPMQRKLDLKFLHIWHNLDDMFQQMSQENVNELNLKFITLAYEKLQKKE